MYESSLKDSTIGEVVKEFIDNIEFTNSKENI